jgi:arylformamidase
MSTSKPTLPCEPELEAQFNMLALRPDFEAGMLQQWLARSARFRRTAINRLDLAYGPGLRDRIDFFPAASAAAPLLIFFHGGYWQRGDKSVYSFLAEPFVARGVAVALVNYTLCPAVRVGEIVEQAQRALAWLWRHAPELPCSRERWFVAGHSAGGQIAARMMASDWPALGRDFPPQMLRGALLISALFDLEPLCQTSINQGMGMDRDEARAASPLQHAPATDAPQMLAVGGAETPVFQRQADAYEKAFGGAPRTMPRYQVPACDHFDVLQALADPDHPFFQRALEFISTRPVS